MADLSASEIEDVREVFDLFDFWDGRDGMVDGAKVADFLRCCGLNPTNALVEKNGGTKKLGEQQYTFEQILPIYKTLSADEDTGTFADFMEGFKTFDREGQGFISAAEMRNVMTMMGEKKYKFPEMLPIYKALEEDADTGTFADFMEGFKTFDREGQGFISSAEMRQVMTMMGETQYKFEEILPIYKVIDEEKDSGTFADFMEGFKTFDREGLGFISAAEMRNVLTMMGQKQYKFEEILPIYKCLRHEDEGSYAEFREGFKTYDREGMGFITSAELRQVLKYKGERMTDPEVDEILKFTDTTEDLDGNIKYEDFIKKVMAGPDVKK